MNANVLRKIPYLTIVACVISIVVSVGMWRTPNCDIPCWYRFGASDLEFIYGGGYWKIYTSAFLHSAWWHLLGNLIFLWSFGKRVELDFGRATWLLLFLVSQPIDQASVALVEGISRAGISGFTFAMFGYLVIADRQPTLWRTLTARKIYVLFVGIMVVLAILFELIPLPELLGLGEFHVAHEAHLAGFLAGLSLGNFFLRHRTVWAGVGAAILPVLAVISLLYNPTSFWWQMARDHEEQVLAYQNLELLSCEVRLSLESEERPKYSQLSSTSNTNLTMWSQSARTVQCNPPSSASSTMTL